MITPNAERAIADALKYGKAILKPIAPNEIPTMTGGKQYGYLLPKGAWHLYTKNPPIKGVNSETEVTILWQNGRETNSRVKWYGNKTRSEYRLTRFGKDFPYLSRDCVGDILVLIPKSYTEFLGYVLDYDEDIEEIQSALGIELIGHGAAYDQGKEVLLEDAESCVDRLFRQFAETLDSFPSTKEFSQQTRQIIQACIKDIYKEPADSQLVKWVDAEYRLFKMVERRLCQNEVVRHFKDIDDFLKSAQTILQRRKSRAGYSLENHVEHILSVNDIPFSSQSLRVRGKPDIIIPSEEAYLDPSYPIEKIIVLGVKMTCKDRWRQFTREAERVEHKHLLTLQQGISEKQLTEMDSAGLKLIVPSPYHKRYPPNNRADLLSVDAFIHQARQILN